MNAIKNRIITEFNRVSSLTNSFFVLKNDFVKEPHPDLVEASQRKNVIDLAQHRKNNSST